MKTFGRDRSSSIMEKILAILLLLSILINDVIHCQRNQQLTILRHVQLVMRHGDRTPVYVEPPNEPYHQEDLYWPEGFGQLTKLGKAKAYRLGELLRKHYRYYLGERYSVREVYVRSSALDRCVETAQLIMAGAYPPNSTLSRWDMNNIDIMPLASLWQPSAIQTFIPAEQDSLLRTDKPCPQADQIKERLMDSRRNRRLLQRHAPLLEQIEQMLQKPLETIESIARVYENLNIMHENGYYWYDWIPFHRFNWTAKVEEDATKQLKLFELAKYRSMFDDPFIKQVRVGELLTVISESFQSKRSLQMAHIDHERDSRLSLYTTHDVKLAALLQALNLWNEQLVPYLGTLMFELHQSRENSSQYYVQLWYLNETSELLNSSRLSLHRLDIPGCDHDQLDEQELMCPLDDFVSLVEQYTVPKDWKHACGIHSELTAMISVNILLLIVNLTIMFFLLMSIMYVCSCINHRSGYQPLR